MVARTSFDLFTFLVITTGAGVWSDRNPVYVDFSDVSGLGIAVDYAHCDSEFYDTPDAVCHLDSFPQNNTLGSLAESAVQCCGFDGYFVFGECPGQDPSGQEYTVMNVQVCHTLTNQRAPKLAVTCSGLGIVRTFEDVPGEENFGLDSRNNPVFKVNGSQFSDFCVSHECHPDLEVWTLSADYCDHVNISALYSDLRSLSPESDLCCGAEAVLEISSTGARSCLDSETMQRREVEETSFSCDWTNKEHLSILEEDELEANNATMRCVSVIIQDERVFSGGISCKPACGGAEPCFRFCNQKGRVSLVHQRNKGTH